MDVQRNVRQGLLAAAGFAVALALGGSFACDSGSSSMPPAEPGTGEVPEELSALDPAACPPAFPWDAHGFVARYELPAARDPLGARLFPLFTILAGDPANRAALAADPALAALSAAARERVGQAVACDGDPACVSGALALDPADVAAAREWLIAEFGAPATALVSGHLLPSGAFMRWAVIPGEPAAALLGSAYDDAIGHVTELAASYAFGRPPEVLAPLVEGVAETLPADALWFEPIEALAIAGLRADGRDEAARYEPLDDGENAAALARMQRIDWSAWRFGAIVVPGQGPEDPDTVLSPLGRQRCDVAVKRWQARLAPFLFTSGGHVHPDRTRYAEALEMKRYLMEAHGVPEDAILVDPHARHTTTNVRNTTRLLLDAGMPPDTAVLVTSDIGQSFYIAALLKPRCERELGYVPWRGGAALGRTDSCLRPTPDVLFVDASDPLDP